MIAKSEMRPLMSPENLRFFNRFNLVSGFCVLAFFLGLIGLLATGGLYVFGLHFLLLSRVSLTLIVAGILMSGYMIMRQYKQVKRRWLDDATRAGLSPSETEDLWLKEMEE